jgi:pimeloyl-ACP methyl ester carboxylesterase
MDLANPKARLQWFLEAQTASRNKAAPVRPDLVRGATLLSSAPEEYCLYPHFRSEDQIPCLAPLIRAYRALPKQRRLVPTSRDGIGARLAVHQVGTGTHERVLVCLPGVMTDHTTWRFVVGALAQNYDFWLVDPPGCGESDAPDPFGSPPASYAWSAMADRALQAIGGCLAETRRPVRLVLVGHSMGGAVALRAAADPELRVRHAEVLGRLEGLVLIAPCDVVMNKANENFLRLASMKAGLVNTAKALGVLREEIAKYLITTSCNVRCLPREEVDLAVHVFGESAHRRAFQAMLREALPFHPADHAPDWPKMKILEGWYQNVRLPVRLLWGECDETLPASMGYKMAAQLPQATLKIIPNCTHAPNIECPAECARFVREAIESIPGGGPPRPK